MSHEAFVALSYGVSALALVGLTVWIIVSARRAKAELDRIERDGTS